MKRNYVTKGYKKGDLVYAKVRPCVILVVRQYVRKLYHCSVQNDTALNEMLYFDGELRPYIPGDSLSKYQKAG